MSGSAAQLYDVQIYAVVRFDVAQVAADCGQDAIRLAISQTDWASRLAADAKSVEELSHFVVHISGDDRQCQSFTSRDQPLLANLARLIIWADGQRDSSELTRILHDARAILANSI